MMFGKFWVGVMAVAVTGLLAFSAPSSHAQPAKPAANKPMSNMPMSDKKSMSHHKMSCYDYAWESQQMKDCLAKMEGKKPMAKKASAKKPAAKPSTKKSS
jgi:hypothetical protein